MPRGFWRNRANQLKYLDWLGERLGYRSRSDWFVSTALSLQFLNYSCLPLLFSFLGCFLEVRAELNPFFPEFNFWLLFAHSFIQVPRQFEGFYRQLWNNASVVVQGLCDRRGLFDLFRFPVLALGVLLGSSRLLEGREEHPSVLGVAQIEGRCFMRFRAQARPFPARWRRSDAHLWQLASAGSCRCIKRFERFVD